MWNDDPSGNEKNKKEFWLTNSKLHILQLWFAKYPHQNADIKEIHYFAIDWEFVLC